MLTVKVREDAPQTVIKLVVQRLVSRYEPPYCEADPGISLITFQAGYTMAETSLTHATHAENVTVSQKESPSDVLSAHQLELDCATKANGDDIEWW